MKTTFVIDPSHEFSYELSQIKDEFKFILAIKALNKIPHYFWFIPASATGQYHPKSSLGIGGLLRHVKSVCSVAIEWFKNPACEFTEDEQDEILIACILHDSCKQGFGSEPSHTLHEHPILVRTSIAPDDLSEDEAECWSRICDLIDTHMGIWNEDSKKRSDVILPLPVTPAQKFVHMCDYLASRPMIEIDTSNRQAQSGYRQNDPTKDAWRLDPAGTSQIEYILGLTKKCQDRGISVSHITISTEITKGEASDTITTLKELLGFK